MAQAQPIQHHEVVANGVRLHYAALGAGPPLLLLHGWPEYWFTYEPLMQRLAGRFSLIAPDLRGFGASEKPDAGPSDQVGADTHAADMLALIDSLRLSPVGIIAHDVGAAVAQPLARLAPDKFTGLFFFDCPYPGIGGRRAAPEHLKETWYQSFHQMPWAADLVGQSRETCKIYFSYFLRHWPARADAFDDVLEQFVDNFMMHGNLQGGFNWYVSSGASWLAAARGEAPKLTPITVPTCVRWGERDPVLLVSWADRLGETFADLDFAPFEGVGHFPHREDPDRAAVEIIAFFDRLAG